ncbi:hypothetical protein [Pleomorphovibrio marinus]|uniref:hypothetical protein n=1 Tax=Pleomorphovibrio marinus TaxID=2164132 RepID=UPI000E0A875E|nr:hypothetical protein [Pleomorphovibrio marinus]
MIRGVKIALVVLGLLVLVFITYSWLQLRDRHPGYKLDLELKGEREGEMKAGFAKVDITPSSFDTWMDVEGNARYLPSEGDTFNDLNGNGVFDAVWLAGFHQNRPASGVNDPLWSRCMVLQDGNSTIGFCVLDMIGFLHDDLITMRKRVQQKLGLDHLIISSTHVHSSPDLMGMWGPKPWKSGVDPNYLEQVFQGIETSLALALENLEPAYFRFAKNGSEALPLVGDTRMPQVFDAGIRVMQVLSVDSNKTLGSILNWGNHPETFWAGNTRISSDFPHYWREYMENGIQLGDSIIHEGLGGVAIFMNGAVGGLMTTRPDHPIVHPYKGDTLLGTSVEKVNAQGLALAKISFEAMASGMVETRKANISLFTKTVTLPLDNPLFRLAALVGIFDRGLTGWGKIRSEVAVWSLGPATFVHVPGELYPEILNGGIESPEGADYDIKPVEVPDIRSQMPGSFRFFSGMSNDMIGYIVPKSQWDEKPPYTYGNEKAPYGEVNSLGPETAPIIHREVLGLLQRLK